MNVVRVYELGRPHLGSNLNVRQLFNPLFFEIARRHPDSTRQRKARLRAKELKAARELKARYVPLCRVDRTVYLEAETWAGHKYGVPIDVFGKMNFNWEAV